MLRVGLTGGVASGKSTVAALLAARGAAVCDADAVVAGLYGPGMPCTRAIATRFGAAVLAADGGVDRRALGARVLADTAARRWLEALVHPAVRAAITAWFEALRSGRLRPDVAIVEAALLAETGSWREYDRIVAVTAPLELRRRRARAAGRDPEAFERVVAAQLDDAAREAVADYIVVNEGGTGELVAAIDRLWGWLQEDAAAVGRGARPAPRRPALRA